MGDELISNIAKIHTTEMGITRIKKNLKIDVADFYLSLKPVLSQSMSKKTGI